MLTEEQIQFLNLACPGKWTEINGVISVKGDVDISSMNLTKIPVQFSVVSNFNCSNNQLTTLEGSPTTIVGWNGFNCSYNQLTTLEGSPTTMTGRNDFNCGNNKLITLEGMPTIVGGNFDCDSNQLTTLEGGPKEVGGYYSCNSNLLTNLIGAPEICNDDFYCSRNNLTNLEGCPNVISRSLWCFNNIPLLMYGIGEVYRDINYNNRNDLNEWIIEQAKKNIYVTYKNIAEWIKQNNKLEFLLNTQQEIRQYFSPRILHLVDMGTYHHNESKILDYKKFSSLC